MYQIINHEEIALSSVIPYLLNFKEFYKLTQQIGNRAQVIEDIAWELLYNLDYKTANGIWLDYIGKKVGQSRIYGVIPDGAFTFDRTENEGFGKGFFLGNSSDGYTKVSRDDYTYRKAILGKIIQNNTNADVPNFIQSLKLLTNATYVVLQESYPASIANISLIGNNVIQLSDLNKIINNLLPAGVDLKTITINQTYNIFDNNAFIQYDNILIPELDNFELSLTVKPTILDTENPTALLSQGYSWASILTPIRLYYDPNYGVVFRTSPEKYSDNYLSQTFYTDEENEDYYDGDAEVFLNGGNVYVGRQNIIKVVRDNNNWYLYINDEEVDSVISNTKINQTNCKLYLGTSNAQYYNSGSIYNLFLKNNTTNTILLNDPLFTETIGINNGVQFITA